MCWHFLGHGIIHHTCYLMFAQLLKCCLERAISCLDGYLYRKEKLLFLAFKLVAQVILSPFSSVMLVPAVVLASPLAYWGALLLLLLHCHIIYSLFFFFPKCIYSICAFSACIELFICIVDVNKQSSQHLESDCNDQGNSLISYPLFLFSVHHLPLWK